MSAKKVDYKIRKVLPLLIVGLFFLFGILSFRAGSENRLPASPPKATVRTAAVQFRADLAEGLAAAAADQKPVLLFFADENCPFSHKMLAETFTDPDVLRLSQSFICIQIDPDSVNLGVLGKDFRVTGTPTVQFISAGGENLLQTPRFQSASEMKSQMEKVLHSVAWRRGNLLLR